MFRQQMNYIYQNALETTPYDLFSANLTNHLKRWRAQGDQIILIMDANEHILRSPLACRLHSDDIELSDISHHFWETGTEPHTYIDGSQPIDGIFTTPNLDVSNFVALSFHESVGDHRTLIVEILTASFIGKYQGNIVRPTSRRLTMRQPRSVDAYNDEIDRQFRRHNIPTRIESLCREVLSSPKPLPHEIEKKCSNLHVQINQIRLRAERGCRKLLKPALEFSPPIQFWYDRAHAYKALIHFKTGKGKRMDLSRVIRLAHRKKIPNPCTLTVEQCRDGLAACKLRQAHLRRIAPSLRQQFTWECLMAAEKSGNAERERAIKERMQIERSRTLWKQLKKATKPSSGRSCLEVQVQTRNKCWHNVAYKQKRHRTGNTVRSLQPVSSRTRGPYCQRSFRT